MEVTLLGTGDTAGTPVPGCDCATCERAVDLGVERTRFSVFVRNERTGESLVVDVSPDFRTQLLREDLPLPDAGVLTHVHYDHVSGIGGLQRLYDHVPLYAAGEPDPATGESVAESVRSRFHFVEPIDLHPVEPFDPVSVCGFEVTLVPVEHPPLASYGVRIEDPADGATLAITGDTNYAIDERSRAVLADADLLLADAVVPASVCERHPAGGDHRDPDGVPRTFGTKHMTREGAVALADDLGAADVRLVHCTHHFGPDEAFAEPLAVDGERFEL